MNMSQRKLWLLLFITSTLHRTIGALSRQKVERTVEVKFKVLITHPELPQAALDILAPTCDIVLCQSEPPTMSEIMQKVQGVHAILWTTQDRITAELLDAAGPRLRVISTTAAVVDFVDLKLLTERNIQLGYTPDVKYPAVADLAIGLLILAARRYHEARHALTTNHFEDRVDWMMGREIRDSHVGFYGFSGIGQSIFRRLIGFGIRQSSYMLQGDARVNLNAEETTFLDMVKSSDIIFISAPLAKETTNAFNMSVFKKMKKNLILINVSRGQIINQKDLYTALKTGVIYAAGLDVTTPQPLPTSDKLLELNNCIITPNLAYSTNRTGSDMAILAAENLLNGLNGQRMHSPVL